MRFQEARALFAVLCACAALAGCTRENPGYTGGGGDGPARDGRVDDVGVRPDGLPPVDLPRGDRLVQPNRPKGVDVLLVVDNSAGMDYPQQWLARDIGTLLQGLDALPGGPSYRIGMVTTDMGVGQFANAGCSSEGDGGKLLVPPGCPQPQNNVGYLQRVGSTTNVAGSLSDALACYIKSLGTGGCGFEQPLKAMRTALGPVNKSFLRAEAALAVVILTNEDDCSAATNTLFDPGDTALGPYSSYRCFQHGVLCDGQVPPLATTLLAHCQPGQKWLLDVGSQFVGFLNALKPAGWATLLAIGGPPSETVTVVQTSSYPPRYAVKESCSSGTTEGYPGFRMQQMVDGLGPGGTGESVCVGNYKSALQSLLLRIQSLF